MNQDERRAILMIHKMYPDYALALADFIDWIRERKRNEEYEAHQCDKPEAIVEDFKKSEYFRWMK